MYIAKILLVTFICCLSMIGVMAQREDIVIEDFCLYDMGILYDRYRLFSQKYIDENHIKKIIQKKLDNYYIYFKSDFMYKADNYHAVKYGYDKGIVTYQIMLETHDKSIREKDETGKAALELHTEFRYNILDSSFNIDTFIYQKRYIPEKNGHFFTDSPVYFNISNYWLNYDRNNAINSNYIEFSSSNKGVGGFIKKPTKKDPKNIDNIYISEKIRRIELVSINRMHYDTRSYDSYEKYPFNSSIFKDNFSFYFDTMLNRVYKGLNEIPKRKEDFYNFYDYHLRLKSNGMNMANHKHGMGNFSFEFNPEVTLYSNIQNQWTFLNYYIQPILFHYDFIVSVNYNNILDNNYYLLFYKFGRNNMYKSRLNNIFINNFYDSKKKLVSTDFTKGISDKYALFKREYLHIDKKTMLVLQRKYGVQKDTLIQDRMQKGVQIPVDTILPHVQIIFDTVNVMDTQRKNFDTSSCSYSKSIKYSYVVHQKELESYMLPAREALNYMQKKDSARYKFEDIDYFYIVKGLKNNGFEITFYGFEEINKESIKVKLVSKEQLQFRKKK